MFFTSYDIGYAVGGSGLILKTVDGGGHWVAQTSGTTRTLFSVHFPTVNVGYAVGEQGTILKTVNGGDTWVPQASGISSWIRSVYFTTVDIGYAVGLGGEILKTIDGGNNWILQNFENISFYSVCFPSVNIGYAVGYNGVILKTEDGGTSWTPQTSGTTKHLRSVYFPSVDDGCVVGIQGTILKTTTGGWCTGFPGKPSGITQICSPSSTYNYTTSGAPFSPTSYMWSINPPEAGTVTGTDTIATVVWRTTYDGIASLRVKGIKEDCVGESSSIEVVINSSNNYPGEFDLISPQNEEWVSSTPLFQWSASTGAQSYNLYIYGVLFKENITETFYQVEADEALTNGTIMWRVVANNGCTTPSNEICTLYVDLNPPAVFSLISPVDNATVSTSRPTFKWNESVDTGSGIDKYQLHISGQEPVDIASSETEYLLTFDLPYGTYTWFVRAYDVVGNFTNSNTHNFTVESPYPDIAETPTGENQLCINPINTNYTTTGTTNATSYIWHINPATAGTITGTGLTATVDWNDTFTGEANISVQGVNDEGVGPLSNPYIVTISPATAPGFVAGSTTICLGETTGMLTLTNYMGTILKWQKRYNGGVWEDIVMTPSPYSAIYYETPTMSGEWQYRAEVQSGACTAEYSAEATIIVIDVPVAGNVITGDETVCQGQTAVTYTVPVIANATSYVWTLPPDATGSSTTNSITIDFGLTAASGYIRVKGVNSCGEGAISTKAITVNPLPTVAGTITGPTTVYQGQTAVTYTVPVIANATSYVWTLPPDATGSSTTNSITIDFGLTAASGYIRVKGVNSCGEGETSQMLITVNPLPVAVGIISASKIGVVCQGESVVYTVPYFPNATSYIWTLPDGATGTSSTNSITVDYSMTAVSGDITVRGVNSYGEGAVSTQAITVNQFPAAAGIISGPDTVCQGDTVIYSVPEIALATSYYWTLPGTGSDVTETNSITVIYGMGMSSGNLSVKGSNYCGRGTASFKPITVNPLPVAVGIISASKLGTVCQGESVVYTVPEITNATSYVWTLPTGATGSSTTNSITVNYGTTAVSGNITVKGVNSCGEGVVSTKAITVNPLPSAAGTISGNATVCQGESGVVYTVPEITNATSYV
ncbi:MAG: YCF48-related protein, partial [Bacteroidales bacterium]|nr:YCF48-related protein [Bacteroidales bacterium]